MFFLSFKNYYFSVKFSEQLFLIFQFHELMGKTEQLEGKYIVWLMIIC